MGNRQIRFSVRMCALAVGLAVAVTGCTQTAAPPPPTRTPAPTFTPTIPGVADSVDANALATVQAAQQAQAAQPVQPVDQGQAAAPGTDGTQPIIESTSVFSDIARAEPGQPAAPAITIETATFVPANPQVTMTEIVNVRGGPGLTYNIMGAANPGQTFPVTGKSPDGQWWQITYNGQPGWVFGELVTAQNAESVAVAQNIPVAPPPPTAAPAPPATNTPVPAAAEPAPTAAPAAPPAGNFPYLLLDTAKCEPNPGVTYFSGFTRDSNNSLINAVCVHIFFYEPRTVKCSGCDGVGDGNWGFSPFGGKPAPPGTTVEIYVVQCPPNLPLGGQNDGFGDLTPQSPKWTHTINESEQCTGITFVRK